MAILSLLLLASCGTPARELVGEVTACTSLQSQIITNPIQLDCLDGSSGAAVNALNGPMIINVWGSWCAPCVEEMDYFRSFYKKADGKVQLIGVDVEEASIKDGQDFVLSNGITWPNLFDRDGRSRAYFGMGVPVTWFISADGSVVYRKIGVFKNEDELRTLAEKYLGIKI